MSEWIYFRNPLIAITDGSYSNAMAISTFHDNALYAGSSNAFIQGLYGTYHPLHVTLVTAYDNWTTQGGIQQGESLNLTQLLQLLSSKIQQWDIKIQNVYGLNTPQYKKILPNRRKPFQGGSQQERMQSVQSLSKAIGTDAALEAVKTDVDAFYTQLNTAYTTQKVSISTTKSTSAELEAACIAMCTAQYANMGALIQEYAATPDKISVYFDMKTLRRSPQTFFTGHIKPNAIVNVAKHTFASDDEIYINNTGAIALQFYLASAKNQKPTASALTLEHGEHNLEAKALGDIANAFVMVYNPDANVEGGYEFEIL
jgi:hypothetical protein